MNIHDYNAGFLSSVMKVHDYNAARQHIEEIKRVKFSIGGEPNPLTEDLHNAVKNLSAELYTKDVHFLMELMQNAEDNEYSTGVDPSLEFVITSKDITRTGASETLLLFNNEIGFSKKNIESICSVGRSTKKGRRREGFVGEKGIGFKSVFLVTAHPYIFSNGYQIKFTENPSPHCRIGYIVPEWVDSNPTIADIHRAYGLDKPLPMTAIVLPLKSEKVEAVKKQLCSVHPELLLFLSKIKRVSVRESNDDPRLPDTVSAISITSEKEFATRKDIDADSHIVFLSAQEGKAGINDHCNYYMWRQRFPVNLESKVDARKDIHEWVISLAFPFGVRLKRGSSSAGVYAFLPTEMVTGFPFVIQADFLLTSSRETVLLDNEWNKGILGCVSSAFVNALVSLAKSVESAPVSSVVHMFNFLPLQQPIYPKLNVVREEIRLKIRKEHIVPCESFAEQIILHKPIEVGRILPAFREILLKLSEQGISLKGISSHGIFVLHSDADCPRFEKALEFLGVNSVDYNWYAKCIQGSSLVLQAENDAYIELLCFIAENWSQIFFDTIMKDVPLLKYVDRHGKISLCSIQAAATDSSLKLRYALDPKQNQLMNKWNVEFGCINGFYFLQDTSAISWSNFCKKRPLLSWLKKSAEVEATTIANFSVYVAEYVRRSSDKSLVLSFTHFLCHSLSRGFLGAIDVSEICCFIPVIDQHGTVIKERKEILLPSYRSKWGKLMGSNPFEREGFVELGEEYYSAGIFAGDYMPKDRLLNFIENYLEASDLPKLKPPNTEFSEASSPLSKEKAILLLEWIQQLMTTRLLVENRFLLSIKQGKWLKTCSGYSPPCQCFLLGREGNDVFSQMGNIGFSPYVIDEQFYEYKLGEFVEELKAVGVKHGSTSEIISHHLMSLSCSPSIHFTKEVAISMLVFVRYLEANVLLTDDIIKSINLGSWLKTTKGYKNPARAFFLDSESDQIISELTDIALVDNQFYGSQIGFYKEELRLLGSVVDFKLAFPVIVKGLSIPSERSCLTKSRVLFILDCVKNSGYQTLLVKRLGNKRWLKTSRGYKRPTECILSDPRWDCFLQILQAPLIDESFYGNSIRSFQAELKAIGVAVDWVAVSKILATSINDAFSSPLTKDVAISMLAFVRYLKVNNLFADPIVKALSLGNWLKSIKGYRSPVESVYWDSEMDLLSQFTDLPLVDELFYGGEIGFYKEELRLLGVAVDFNQVCPMIARGFVFPSDACCLTNNTALFILGCLKNSYSKPLLRQLRSKPWLKTSLGYKLPSECILSDPSWDCISHAVQVPLVDESFYGTDIRSFKPELMAIGVALDLVSATLIVASAFQKLASSFSLTDANVLSLLDSLKQLRETQYSSEVLTHFNRFLFSERWLRTRLGYRSASSSILFDRDWLLVSQIADLPFVEDKYYGTSIYSYKDELSKMGVTVKYSEGHQFVFKCLKLPRDPDTIQAGSVISLLECVRSTLRQSELTYEFLWKAKEVKWLKTQFGYAYPQESFLYGSHWTSSLKITDAPFIDDQFYGKNIYSFKNELKILGVTLNVGSGCSIIARALRSHTRFTAIKRLYNYLSSYNWALPFDKSANWIWIPNESCTDGDWVGPECCVLSDPSGLFQSRMRILDKYYEEPLLSFFSSAIWVPHSPSIEDYIKLWKDWEADGSDVKVKYSDCYSYWVHVIGVWNNETEKKFTQCMKKVPAMNLSGDGIRLVDTQQVFIPDDLQLKLIFGKAYPEEPLFVWYLDPTTSSVPLSKSYEIYSRIGVRKISESVKMCADSLKLNHELQELNQRESPIRKGLIKLILGFLANPSHNISVEKRHGLAKSLLDLAVFETEDTVTVTYMLSFPSRLRSFVAKVTDITRWEKDSSMLIIKKAHEKQKRISLMEFAVSFAKVISNGLLWDYTDLIDDLLRLIQTGCIMGFDKDVVDFLLVNANLQLFREDEEFLSTALSTDEDAEKCKISGIHKDRSRKFSY